MSAMAEVAKLLGDIELSPGQLAQVRALDRKYAQLDYDRRGTKSERRTALQGEILALLTPEQWSEMERHSTG